MNYLSELKRRNVFKVVVAYLALGWVVVQITDVAVPAFNLSPTLNGIVFYIWLVGLPIALFFAWAFELTPDGVKKTAEVDVEESIRATTGQKINYIIFGLMAIAIAFLLYDRGGEAEEVIVAGAPVEVELANTIAVMPFTDMSANGDQEYFGDGIAEEILNVLVGIDELTVTSRTSSFAFKDQNLLSPEIAERLGVNYILDGSIRSDGNNVRVTAQLIDVAADAQLWSDTYDRELTSIFSIQDEISREVADALRIELVGAGTAIDIPTTNMEAYTLYLQGRQLYFDRGIGNNKYDTDNLIRALDLYERAVALDPIFAEAWAELATINIILPSHGSEYSFENLTPRSTDAVNRAISLKPDLAQAWVAKGWLHSGLFQFEEAEAALLRATELNPNNETAWLWLGLHFGSVGSSEKAIKAAERAVKIGPNSVVNQQILGMLLHTNGDVDDAASLIDKIIDENGYERARINRAYLAMEEGNPISAQQQMIGYYTNYYITSNEESELKYGIYANTYFDETLKEQTGRLLDDDNDEGPGAFFGYYMLQDAERMADKFEAISFHKSWALNYIYIPLNRPLFKKKVFRDYLIEIGLLSYWKNHQFPDFCRAFGEDDFECE